MTFGTGMKVDKKRRGEIKIKSAQFPNCMKYEKYKSHVIILGTLS